MNPSLPTLRINNINLHSPYNPKLEAKKIVDRQLQTQNPLAIIIIEPGLGYCIEIIKQRFPHCKIIALHIYNGIKNQARWSTVHTWEPRDGKINAYISYQLWQLAFPIVNIIENPAAQKINQSLYITIKKTINHELQRLVSHYTTVASFTKQWITNCIRNCIQIENKLHSLPYRSLNSDAPVILIGSGPSLDNRVLEAITNCQPYCSIWCLSSAMTILNHYNIIPNILVTTDGGHWASYHLHNVPKSTIIAMPLTAKIHYAVKYNPVLFFNQQSVIEQATINTLYGDKSFNMLPCASVASSAIELAQYAQTKTIILVGIDFAFHDGKQATLPHAFTSFREQDTSILNNRESADFDTFSKSLSIKTQSVSTTLRMSNQHHLYRAELEAVLTRCKLKKNIYQCESINPLHKVKQLTVKQLRQYIELRRQKTFTTPANVLPNIERKQFIQFDEKKKANIIDSITNTIIHAIENETTLTNSQTLKELCFGLAHKEYLQFCKADATLGSRNREQTKLKKAVILQLSKITERYNR